MAKKKTKKRSTGLSRGTRTHSIKRRPKRRRKLLSEGSWAGAGKAIASGAAGGAASLMMDYIIPDTYSSWRGPSKILAGIAIARFTGMNNFGAGMAGAGMADTLQKPLGLSEGSGNWGAKMENMPMFLAENGKPLSEAKGRMLLSDNSAMKRTGAAYLPDYMPDYI